MSNPTAGKLKKLSRVAGVLCLLGTALFFTLVPSSVHAAKTPETIAIIDSALADTNNTLSGKVVYVDFWASWCVPCRKSYPWLGQLAHDYGPKGLSVITVNLDKDRKAADKFLSDLGVSLPVVYDPKGELAKVYGLSVMPTAFLYGRDGRLQLQHEGFHPDDTAELESEILKLLKENPAK